MKSLRLYKEKKISLGLAAKIAGVSVGEFIDLLKEYGLALNLELEDAKLSFKYAQEIIKNKGHYRHHHKHESHHLPAQHQAGNAW